MDEKKIKELWKKAIHEILNVNFDNDIISTLSSQTIDSIRRISIYETYAKKAKKAEELNLSYNHTSNPFILSQRSSLDTMDKIWFIYLATYFGKSNKSKWTLFNKAAFRKDKNLISLKEIQTNRTEYYIHLKNINFFEGANFSNHRKFTKKSLDGEKGVIHSIDFFLDNLNDYSQFEPTDFDIVFNKALKIPNFGRMAAFDFTASLCKCKLNVNDPMSMYHHNSTGPLKALKDFLILANYKNNNKSAQVKLGDELLDWFIKNSNISIVAQVLEDAICNWQKSPKKYKRYFG